MGSFGLGRLEEMGRTIKEEAGGPHQLGYVNKLVGQNSSQTFKFRSDIPQRANMASSVICFNKNTEGNSSVGRHRNSIQVPQNIGFNGLSGLNSLSSRARTVKEEEIYNDSDEKQMNSSWVSS